jgi:hypothetical protein
MWDNISISTREALIHSIMMSEVKIMTSFVFGVVKACHKKSKHVRFVSQPGFYNLIKKERKKEYMRFKLLATTFPPLKLTFFNSLSKLLKI